MEISGDTSYIKKTKRLYKFCVYQIKEIKPIGNRIRNLPCPLPRSGHRIVIFKGSVFAIGGYTPRDPETNEIIVDIDHRHIFKELWQFNFASRTWFNLKTSGIMPTELASHTALLINNTMLTYGGTGVPFGESSSNSTHLCNLNSLEWFALDTSGDKPTPLYGQAVALYNDKLYVVGGTTGFAFTICVHCLNLHTKKWERLDTKIRKHKYVPPPRYRHEIAICDNRIFVLGGGTNNDRHGFDKIPTFDLDSLTWTEVTTAATEFPNPRLCHGSVQIGTDVYIFGGYNGRRIYSDIWKINLRQLQWQKLNVEMPLPLYFHSVAVSEEGQAFIFGGVTSTDNEIRTNEIFSIWLKIPSLSSICWQSLLCYIPHIAQLDKKKLFRAGIPLQYLDQIEFDSADQRSKICCKFDSF